MLTHVFGIPVRYEEWKCEEGLPIYLRGKYDFKIAYFHDKECILIKPKANLDYVTALQKQISRIKEYAQTPVILDLVTVSNFRRKSLIENRIPFISTKQVFLPFIGTILEDEQEKEPITDRFFYSTQQLFLYYLYNNKRKLYVSQAGQSLPFTAMTLTRAVKQLEATGLFIVTKDGVRKVIESKYNRLDLFKKAEPYLSSPVCQTAYIEKTKINDVMVVSGQTALSKKTIINPERMVTYAVKEKEVNAKLLTKELVDTNAQVKLELWAYSPKLFSQDNVADDLSVALSFKDTKDERIEEAVKEMLERRLTEEWLMD